MKRINIVLVLLISFTANGQSSIILEASRKMNINNQTSYPNNDASDSKFIPSFSNEYKIGYRYNLKKINSYAELSLGYFSIKQKAIVPFSSNFADFKPVTKASSFGKLELLFYKPINNSDFKLKFGVLGTIDRFFTKPFKNKIPMKADLTKVDSAYAEITINKYAFDSRVILICGLTYQLKQFKYGDLEIGFALKQGFKSIETLNFDFYAYGKNNSQPSYGGHVISLTNGQSISFEIIYLFHKRNKSH